MEVRERRPKLKAPYPWMGGKSAVADIVWDRLGDVDNFAECFAGSIAVLLRRPAMHTGRIETISDVNHYVVNFWRAVQRDPDAVAEHADNPVIEADLHARHRWLELSAESSEHKAKIIADPDYFDARIAGWWAWGQSTWIGGGWCQDWGKKIDGTPKLEVPRSQRFYAGIECGHSANGKRRRSCNENTVPVLGDSARGCVGLVGRQRKRSCTENTIPVLRGTGDGVNGGLSQKIPVLTSRDGVHNGGRPQLGDAYDIGRGVNSHGYLGTCAERRRFLRDWMQRLSDRLRLVRVCYGHWARICSSETTTTRLGTTGIFLDPPYPTHKPDGTQSRDGSLYHGDDRTTLDTLRDEVLAYCREYGPNPDIRIAVCGYDDDGYAALEAEGWTVHAWKSQGGYANRAVNKGKVNENRGRERIWFSPACMTEPDLFAATA